MLRSPIGTYIAGAALLCLTVTASAQEAPPEPARVGRPLIAIQYTGTLKKIQDSGVIRLGHRENSIPFAFLDPNGKPVGYALDLCAAVVNEVIAELYKDIRVEYRPVTPENRFDLVASGEIDLECGSTTNNFERRKRFAFSPTMFVTGTKLLVRRDSGIRSFRDLERQDGRGHARHSPRGCHPEARRTPKACDPVRNDWRPQRVVQSPRVRKGGCVRERRRPALRHDRRNENRS